MFRSIAAFEWRYQLRNPVFWIGCLIFFLLAFGASTTDSVQIGNIGNAHRNSPYAILQALAVCSVFSIFITVAMVANVIVRDDETHFAPIIRTTSVGKAAYLVGRFVGASAAALLVLATVPLGVMAGSAMPWVDAERIGAFLPGDYLFALLVYALPTLLLTAAAVFAIATATRSMMWTYVCAIALLVFYFVARGLARNDTALDRFAALADPFALSTLSYVTKYWTTTERNTQLPALAGVFLLNRVLWIGVAAIVFGVAYRAFRFEMTFDESAAARATGAEKPFPAVATGRLSRQQRAARAHEAELAALGEANPAVVRELATAARKSTAIVPDIPPATPATGRAQLWELAKIDMSFVFRSPAFFVLVAVGLLNSGLALTYAGEIYGSPSYPVTRLMVQALTETFSVMPIAIAVFYAGELVWRDRDRGMHEIIDAAVAPDWARMVPKIVALALVLLSTALIAVLAAIALQAVRGYVHFQVGAYLLWFVWPVTVGALLTAILAMFVQTLVPQKHIGWAVMLAWLVAAQTISASGVRHDLFFYGGTPEVPLSDMNGQGRFWIAQAWFQVYWLAFATMLCVLMYGLWRRGAIATLRARAAQLRHRLRGRPLRVLVGAAVVWAGSGAWIFYNTNVLNGYMTQPARDRLAADAEKALLPYEGVVQPRVADVTLDVQLFPRESRAVTHGRYTLVNRSTQPISTLHVQWDGRLRLDQVAFDGATVQTDYPRFNYRIYRLAVPMQPGERRVLGFTTTLEQRGFVNDHPLTSVVANGTFVDNLQIAPAIGFQRGGLLEERAKRRKYGLPSELRPASLADDSARAKNAFTPDSDWVDSDITVTTDGDQTAVAPGRTVSDTGLVADPDARRTTRFRSDAPIMQLFSIQSARYDVRRSVWHGPGHDVDLAVYYMPGHEYNVNRMLDAMRLSLALCTEKFGPYQFSQARIVEFPAYETSTTKQSYAQSFPNTIAYQESVGFVQHYSDPDRIDAGDREKIDVATYVTAHEISHQWWGHQLAPSGQEGAEMLTETFAQYSALLAMERKYGHDEVGRFLKYELDRYLRSRGGAGIAEQPLAQVEPGGDQRYIYYNKGSLAMYWAKEALGEAVVDGAMRKMLATYAFKGAPYPNTRDFLTLLRAEAGPRNDALITDLFEKITLLDLRATNATARKRADGKVVVAFDIEARKLYADGVGHQTEVPMDEAVEIGAFAAEPGTRGFGHDDVLWLQPQIIESGGHHVELVVDRAPAWVGIDPYNKRIDRNSDDNLTAVRLQAHWWDPLSRAIHGLGGSGSLASR